MVAGSSPAVPTTGPVAQRKSTCPTRRPSSVRTGPGPPPSRSVAQRKRTCPGSKTSCVRIAPLRPFRRLSSAAERLPCKQRVEVSESSAGSKLPWLNRKERLPSKQRAAGSNPAGSANMRGVVRTSRRAWHHGPPNPPGAASLLFEGFAARERNATGPTQA